MTTLRHPHVEGMTVDVPDDQAQAWRDQGWKSEPKTKSATSKEAGNA